MLRKPAHIYPLRESAISRHKIKSLLRKAKLHTVCESAKCPNIGECFSLGVATFLILGDVCTRSCGFCAVKKGRPDFADTSEPERVAAAALELGLKHIVVTSVTRDDLEDGGAGIFADTTKKIREKIEDATVELLIPDFKGSLSALEKIIAVAPDVLNHNVETVPRLYPVVRPEADWNRSLQLIERTAHAGLTAKSGMMLGMGESLDEVERALVSLRNAGASIVTLGQYLAPTKKHLPVLRFLEPREFEDLQTFCRELGFSQIVSSPLARSSYHASALSK